jgi:hypothetical protein
MAPELVAGAAGLAVVVAAVIAFVVMRRRRARRILDRDERLAAARRATRQIAWDRTRERRGSLRGKGGGGNDGRAPDAGVGTDGGMP